MWQKEQRRRGTAEQARKRLSRRTACAEHPKPMIEKARSQAQEPRADAAHVCEILTFSS